MKLLTIEDIRRYVPEAVESPGKAAPQPAVDCSAPGQFLVGKQGVDLAAVIGDLRPEGTKFLLSEGDWSMHELIDYLYHVAGPATFALTSWGLSEKPLQRVLDLVRDGTAQDPIVVLDYRVKLQSAAAYQLLLASGLDIRLTDNHSKMMVLINEQWAISVFTSANLTRNPRLEFYVISTKRHVAEAFRHRMVEIHREAQPMT